MTNNHYYKDVSHLQSIDIYRICKLYDVTDPCIQHAIKKLLCSGIRNGGKDQKQDILEVIETLNRWLKMLEEDNNANNTEQIEGRQPEVREGMAHSSIFPEQGYGG